MIKTIKEKTEIKSGKTPIYLSIPLSEMEVGEHILEVKDINNGREFK